MFHTCQGIEYGVPYVSTAVYVTYTSMAGNTTYNVLHHLFHYQIVVSSVYIEISGYQSSEDAEHVLTHQDHPRLPPRLPPATICAQPPPFDPRDCKVPLTTLDDHFQPQFAIRGYEE